MQTLYSRCCGIDVHKGSVTVCVLVYSDSPEPGIRKEEFATHFKALLNLKMWLLAQKVTHVAMESTGVTGTGLAGAGAEEEWRLPRSPSS